MPHIHPVTELKNNLDQLAKICHSENEPVYLTRKGHGELVLMSLAGFQQMQAKLELYQKLDEAEAESKNSKTRLSHEDVMQNLRSRLA
ncbi:MAG: type II toxin-antitoxin system Phd/YefM family antitoxin [Desulfuromonadales bacterium]